jgi:hypothetical protein
VRDVVSVPPRADELSDIGRRDWTTGIELIRTCMATHDTKTYVLRLPSRPWNLFFLPQLIYRNVAVPMLGPARFRAKGARAGDRAF